MCDDVRKPTWWRGPAYSMKGGPRLGKRERSVGSGLVMRRESMEGMDRIAWAVGAILANCDDDHVRDVADDLNRLAATAGCDPCAAIYRAFPPLAEARCWILT